MTTNRFAVLLASGLMALPAAAQTPIGTGFSYQGRLTDAGAAANGSDDLQFKLFDAVTAGSQSISMVNSIGGNSASIAIGADGFPVIGYSGATTQAIRVAKFVNASCTGSSTITTVDESANLLGSYTRIRIGADGNPVISYLDSTFQALKFLKCSTADCP